MISSLFASFPGLAPLFSSILAQAAGTSRIELRHYLTVSALVFTMGILVVVIRRNAIAVLMGIELLLNAAGLNFVAFAKYVSKDPVDGQVVTIFVIVLAAAEAALALAIILNVFHNTNSIEVSEVDSLKG